MSLVAREFDWADADAEFSRMMVETPTLDRAMLEEAAVEKAKQRAAAAVTPGRSFADVLRGRCMKTDVSVVTRCPSAHLQPQRRQSVAVVTEKKETNELPFPAECGGVWLAPEIMAEMALDDARYAELLEGVWFGFKPPPPQPTSPPPSSPSPPASSPSPPPPPPPPPPPSQQPQLVVCRTKRKRIRHKVVAVAKKPAEQEEQEEQEPEQEPPAVSESGRRLFMLVRTIIRGKDWAWRIMHKIFNRQVLRLCHMYVFDRPFLIDLIHAASMLINMRNDIPSELKTDMINKMNVLSSDPTNIPAFDKDGHIVKRPSVLSDAAERHRAMLHFWVNYNMRVIKPHIKYDKFLTEAIGKVTHIAMERYKWMKLIMAETMTYHQRMEERCSHKLRIDYVQQHVDGLLSKSVIRVDMSDANVLMRDWCSLRDIVWKSQYLRQLMSVYGAPDPDKEKNERRTDRAVDTVMHELRRQKLRLQLRKKKR